MEFYVVYIREAHPSDGWQLPINERQNVIFAQPTTMDERVEVAQACSLDLGLEMPTLIDAMSNEVDEAYAALPDRLDLVDEDGRVAYRSGPGPMGFSSDDFERAIREQLGLDALEPAAPTSTGGPAAPPVEGIAGTWKVTIESPMGKRDGDLELRVDGSTLGGSWATAMGAGEVSGSADGAELEWTVSIRGPMGEMRLAFIGTIEGDALSGEVQFGGMGSGAFSATRA